MLRNDCGALKNGDTIFKSQVVDSYLCTNTSVNACQMIIASGLSQNNSVDIYYATPTALIKCSNTSDLTGGQMVFPATSESSYKDWYYCGDGLECVTSFEVYNTNGCYGGDLVCHMNQFPNLRCLCMIRRENDFNIDISNCSFPQHLETFYLCDRGITGDLSTVKNFSGIKNLCLSYTPFTTANLGNIGNDFSCVNLCWTPSSLQYCVNDLVENSTCMTEFTTWYAQGTSLCADTLDVSDFKTFCIYAPFSNVKGNMSGWTFNTGLTYHCQIACCLYGDITNWDYSNTCLNQVNIQNYNYYASPITGDLSSWSFPNSLQYFCLYGVFPTCIPDDYSNTDLRTFGLYQVCGITNDINNMNFGDNLTSMNINYTTMCGNLENYTFPTGVTNLYYSQSEFIGNLSGITVPNNANSVQLCWNNLSGELMDFYRPSSIANLNFSYNTGVTFTLSSTFDTCNITDLCLSCISGITGSFTNLTVGNSLSRFAAQYTPICPSINDFNINSVKYFELYNNGICDDITPFLTGATGTCYLCLAYNYNLSGDTTGLDFSCTRNFVAYNTALSGTMCHFNPFCFRMNNTCISSDIGNDFDFSGQGYYIYLQNNCLNGHLSGVTHNFTCIYYFQVGGNSNIYGSNEYTNYIFVNRKNFIRNSLQIAYNGIADTVSGTTEELGSLGTYPGDPSGMDLTEEQINNLVAGTDYDGLGTNTPWDGKEKIWWMKNACVSSSSTTKRYSTFNISYS